MQEITRDNLRTIRNPVFRDYAAMYLDIYESFMSDVKGFGLPFSDGSCLKEAKELINELRAMPEIETRCDDASLVYKRISTACEACKKGLGSITCHISFKCHRKCFFCFNPNQDNYEEDLNKCCDWRGELDGIKSSGGKLTHIALTGGEPLLFAEDSIEFFRHARELYPDAHLRLYTSGDMLTEELAEKLAKVGLNEIRFSYKMEDPKDLQEKVLSNMAMAKKYIPAVMVEMPVMPEREEEMKVLLNRLSDMEIWGINLLELCFPYNNADAFRVRGYALKNPPFRTLYNFWYAGGLPVANSEVIALRLMKYAVENKLRLGVHYCSLENKNFGQMYYQNHVQSTPQETMLFSEKDYYLKTVKAFGEDAKAVKRLFDKRGANYSYNNRGEYIQFRPEDAKHLRGRNVELALSVNVMEEREGEIMTRELKLVKADVNELVRESL